MGSRPSAPVTYRPTPTAPTIYQSIVPEEDYKNLSNYVSELKAQREKKIKDREAMGFGGSAFQQRMKQYAQAEQDTYAKAAPKKPLGGGSTTP
jgi:hypothetical protein